jgi:hypothetical protein
MDVPTSEVSYTSATTGRGDHEVHKGHVVGLEKIDIIVLYFKLSSCSECCVLSFGWFTGVWILCADVSEHCLFHLHRRCDHPMAPLPRSDTKPFLHHMCNTGLHLGSLPSTACFSTRTHTFPVTPSFRLAQAIFKAILFPYQYPNSLTQVILPAYTAYGNETDRGFRNVGT